MNEIEAYDYDLPEELIARYPPERREDARLLVVERCSGRISHHSIADLPDLLRSGDQLVLNNTRVLPARLLGVRAATGGQWEGLFLESRADGAWKILGQTRGKLRPGERIELYPATCPDAPDRLQLLLLEKDTDGGWLVRAETEQPTIDALQQFGTVPLPPYMRRSTPNTTDAERYQTVYAQHPGSVAAPTAGLHFTPDLLQRCAARGIGQCYVTLHVGVGTFRPIAVDRLDQHQMHAEWCSIPDEVATQLQQVSAKGGRIVSVGTTTVRTLETAAQSGSVKGWTGSSSLFIRPPYEFRAVDVLLTNFHLPRSSLLVLVSAFGGRELIQAAYRQAIENRYRFYSYGDAMLIV